ncbi:MAG: Gfo/Idh/MocA family oxidoreductase [Synergistaceae bacterium]|nr:Gfo/Idh/MocA family oxidoreductase [Synergistaceae bacterium]
MEAVRLGTIGSGVIVHSVLDNVRNADGISLEAVYSRTSEKAEALAETYGAGKTYTDINALMNDDTVNTVYIASPNLLHYEQARLALMAGKNVICEKPLVTRYAQAQELRDIAREKGLFLFQAAPTVYLPNFRLLREKLPVIGRVRLVMSNYSQYSSRYDAVLRGERPNIFSLEFAGGCLMDINFYNVLLNVALFGRPESAEYFPNIFPGPGLADTSGVFVMRYDGFVSTNAGAKDTWGINHFTIEGEQGYIHVDEPNGIKSVRVVTRDSDDTYNLQPVPDRWHYEVEEIVRLMLTDDYGCAYSLLDAALDTVSVIEGARKNAGIIFPGDE